MRGNARGLAEIDQLTGEAYRGAAQPRRATVRAVITLLILGELALVAAVFVADRQLIPLSKTPFLLALGWLSLRIRGLRWRDLGLVRFRSWPTTLAIGAAAGICTSPAGATWRYRSLPTASPIRSTSC